MTVNGYVIVKYIDKIEIKTQAYTRKQVYTATTDHKFGCLFPIFLR